MDINAPSTDGKASVSDNDKHFVQALFTMANGNAGVFEAVRNARKKLIDLKLLLPQNGHQGNNGDSNGNSSPNLIDLFPEFKNAELFESFSKVIESGNPFKETLHYTYAGNEQWFQLRVQKFQDGLLISRDDILLRNLKADEI